MSSDYKIQTIEDMEFLYYSRFGQPYIEQEAQINPFITKASGPAQSTTTGVYNAVFGAQAWIQLNMEANVFGVLPKVPQLRSGWRQTTARGSTLPAGGQAQNASLPAPKIPEWVEVDTLPKINAHTFSNTEIQEFLAKSGDDAIADMEHLRNYFAVEHKEDINVQLMTQGGTPASNNWESVDRVAASNAEYSNCNENNETTGFTANDLNMYSDAYDRDSTSYADAYVNHNSSTVHSLTDSIIQALQQNTLDNGANYSGQFWMTKYDTWAVVNQIYDPQVRYNLIGEATIAPGINGIKTLPGRGVGTQIATLFDKPVILSKDVVQDTGGVGRLYLLDISNPEGFDMPRLCIRIAKPTQYFEAGMNQGTPHMTDTFGTEGMYRTMGELICTFPAVQGKARDLKS